MSRSPRLSQPSRKTRYGAACAHEMECYSGIALVRAASASPSGSTSAGLAPSSSANVSRVRRPFDRQIQVGPRLLRFANCHRKVAPCRRPGLGFQMDSHPVPLLEEPDPVRRACPWPRLGVERRRRLPEAIGESLLNGRGQAATAAPPRKRHRGSHRHIHQPVLGPKFRGDDHPPILSGSPTARVHIARTGSGTAEATGRTSAVSTNGNTTHQCAHQLLRRRVLYLCHCLGWKSADRCSERFKNSS